MPNINDYHAFKSTSSTSGGGGGSGCGPGMAAFMIVLFVLWLIGKLA